MGRREWTKDEETYMYRRYLYQSVESTAKYLDRSISSVKHKASKMLSFRYKRSSEMD